MNQICKKCSRLISEGQSVIGNAGVPMLQGVVKQHEILPLLVDIYKREIFNSTEFFFLLLFDWKISTKTQQHTFEPSLLKKKKKHLTFSKHPQNTGRELRTQSHQGPLSYVWFH